MPIVVMGAGVPAVLGVELVSAVANEVPLSVAEVAELEGAAVIEEEKPVAKSRKRARVGGRFRADDPSTPTDEAWEE